MNKIEFFTNDRYLVLKILYEHQIEINNAGICPDRWGKKDYEEIEVLKIGQQAKFFTDDDRRAGIFYEYN